MAIAVGVDLVRVARVRRLLEDNPAAEREIFTERERDYCACRRDRYIHLAARFAAKEATFKALGTGVGPGCRWTDVEVVNTRLGRPTLRLTGGASRTTESGEPVAAEISLSHTGDYAIASVVLVHGGAV
ncbi:holo-ACP synthase [Streptomyces sp. NBC_01304]|uniref:holo-ACP synthase n=1 Tax=Streptomyces sp. NBC_01304 TaxID=2903818 RepID=UPI002E0D253B|nr:holo-ACP synthase [Streptomyces sp. NBC_01304]